VEVKHFSNDGELLNIERLEKTGKRNNYSFESETLIKGDGYVVVSIDNISKNPIMVSGSVMKNAVPDGLKADKSINTRSFRPDGGSPITNSEEPPAWENNLDGVTIIGTTASGEFRFNSPYQSDMYGAASDWQVVAMQGGSNGDGGNGGNGGEPDPGPEEKKIVREANEAKLNVCEFAYVLGHLDDQPLLGKHMYDIEKLVYDYMQDNDMGNANSNGAAIENAFKHALLGATMICWLGGSTGQTLLNFHETCLGKNMNPTEAERTMDTFNNGIGVSFVNGYNCANFDHLIDDIWDAFSNGGLHDINGNPTHVPRPQP